jgi:hypothetical protein
MAISQPHYFRDILDRTYAFSSQPLLAEQAAVRRDVIIPCRTYARQTFQSIIDARQDPFSNGLMDLWLELYQRPWDKPATLERLVEDLAIKVERREVLVYLVDSPLWQAPPSARN